MNTKGQITIRGWYALPKAERTSRAEAFHAADEALQANGDREDAAGITWETGTYLALNHTVNDLWPTVPWWVRWRGIPTPIGAACFLIALAIVVFAAIRLAD